MRSLAELVSDPHGRAFLAERGAHCDARSFRDSVGADASVWVGHQLQADYGPTVVAKFRALAALASDGAIEPATVWLDTDRIGSQTSITTIVWRDVRARLVPHRLRDREARFAPVDPGALDAAVATLAPHVRRADLLAGLRDAAAEAETLADVTLAISTLVLGAHLGLRARSVVVSRALDEPTVTTAINDVIANIDDVITVFNAAIDALAAVDVDPVVKPLREDYLPLHYFCDRDGSRRRLARRGAGAAAEAAVACGCGEEHRFSLRDGVGELAATKRWSVDVTLPLYLDRLFSGLVAGRSSALYGLVLGEVSAKVFGRPLAPMLVPSLDASDDRTLLQHYLEATG